MANCSVFLCVLCGYFSCQKVQDHNWETINIPEWLQLFKLCWHETFQMNSPEAQNC